MYSAAIISYVVPVVGTIQGALHHTFSASTKDAKCHFPVTDLATRYLSFSITGLYTDVLQFLW